MDITAKIAEELGISEFEAEMLPDQKYSELEKVLDKFLKNQFL